MRRNESAQLVGIDPGVRTGCKCVAVDGTGKFLENDRSPGRKLGTIDNRGSHFYLCLYGAQALAGQSADLELARAFEPIAAALSANEPKIVAQLHAVQGQKIDIGGYYQPDQDKADAALRPSPTLNGILATL